MSTLYDYDYIVIGSGFGGPVAALRLAEKGYGVGVMEKGKRFRPGDFPESNLQIRKYLWMPRLRMHGILQITWLKNLMVLHGAAFRISAINSETTYGPIARRCWGCGRAIPPSITAGESPSQQVYTPTRIPM